MTTNKPSFIDQPARQLLLSAGAARLLFGAQALAMNAFALAGARLLAGSLGGFGMHAVGHAQPSAKNAASSAGVPPSAFASDLSPEANASATNSRAVNSPRASSTRRRTAKK